MKIVDIISGTQGTAFSFEILPPLKGTGMGSLLNTVRRLREYDPKYINITTHRSEYVYTETDNGRFVQRTRIRRRPGTIAVAAAVQNETHIPVVPHVLCSGFTREDIEYMLLDLQFLGIENILLLRGDKAKEDARFIPTPDGYAHTTELQEQVNRFNEGFFVDGTPIKVPGQPFSYGVACYPEKHEEALNPETDFEWFKKKVALGAEYAVTQLFYDNAAYFRFVEKARKAGITVPIIPGLKPISVARQIDLLPRSFHLDIPQDLVNEILKAKTKEQVYEAGVAWCVAQSQDLLRHGVPAIHYYTMGKADNIRKIVKTVF